ncbi:MAG: plastocyanin/azurin family copper-binding protein [Actinomycetota bacterium]
MMSVTSGRIVVALLAATALLVFAAPSQGDTFRIKAAGSKSEGWDWRPDFKGISKGDRIVWRNPTAVKHTVTAYKGPWSKDTVVGPGETTRKRFRKNGAYYYRCKIHSTMSDGVCSGMCGHIHVS